MAIGFDQGSEEQAKFEFTEAEKAQRQVALDAYFAKVQDLKKQQETAATDLDKLNQIIAQRESELQSSYVKRVEDLGSEIESAKATLLDLTEQVKETMGQLDSKRQELARINLDLSGREAALKAKQDQCDALAADLASQKDYLDTRSASLEQISKGLDELVAKHKERNDLVEADLAAQRTKIDQDQANIRTQQNSLDALRATLEKEHQQLLSDKAGFDERMTAAAPLLAQAEVIREQLTDIGEKTAELKTWQNKLDADANQIRATQLAQNEKSAELAQREKVVAAAEKALAQSKG